MGRAKGIVSRLCSCSGQAGLAIMRFCIVTPRSFKGWKSFGGFEPFGCGSEAVPAGGCCAGV